MIAGLDRITVAPRGYSGVSNAAMTCAVGLFPPWNP
jgi:hypothetical protein